MGKKPNSNRIYAFVTDSEPKFVKFGVSVDPKKRLDSVACGCPFPVSLVGSVKGGYNEEKKLHLALHEYHAHGEWFECRGDSMEAMKMIESKDVAGLGGLVSDLFHKRMRGNIPFKRKIEEISNWG